MNLNYTIISLRHLLEQNKSDKEAVRGILILLIA